RSGAAALELDEGAGGDAEDAMEGTGELEGVGVAEFVGDVADANVAGLEALGGVAHFETEDELPGALVGEAFEKAAEVGLIDAALGGDLAEAFGLAVVAIDPLAAALEGVEGGG